MSRPKQDGLLYFSFDVDFFYADKRIKRLHSRYGNDGLMLYIYLLTEIYRNGYYTRWDGEAMEDAMDDLNLTEGLIEQVMAFLASRSLLVKRTLAGPDTAIASQKVGDGRPQCELADGGNGQERVTVITSPGIQRRYQEAVKGRKRDFYVDEEIWLLGEEETAAYIKFTQNRDKSQKNRDKSQKNRDKSQKNHTNKSKENKSKENKKKEKEIGVLSVDCFEDFWNPYPNKQRRSLAEKAYCDLLVAGAVTEGELAEASRNYAEHVKKTGERMYLPNNFLEKCVFEDFLPGRHGAGGHNGRMAAVPMDLPLESLEDNGELVGDDWMDYGPGWEGRETNV